MVDVRHHSYERSLPGFDLEVGFSFTDSFAGYFGGYYFHKEDMH